MAKAKTSKFRTPDGSRVKPAQCYESLWFKISAVLTAEGWALCIGQMKERNQKYLLMSSRFIEFDRRFQRTNRLTGVHNVFNFFWLSSSWILLTDGELGHTALAPHTFISSTSLTGCLGLEVKVGGSVWGMVPGTSLLGGVGYAVGGSYINRTFINMGSIMFGWGFAGFFLECGPTCRFMCVHAHKTRTPFSLECGSFKTPGRDGKHLLHLYF